LGTPFDVRYAPDSGAKAGIAGLRIANVKIFILRKKFSSYLVNRAFRLRASGTITAHSEIAMALFKLPLSGDVVQWINPVTWFMSGNQVTANVYLGESSAPEVEAEILDRVGTYGRQLGQLIDAVTVLLEHLRDHAALTPDDRKAIAAFETMANEIAGIKEKHRRHTMRPSRQLTERSSSIQSADAPMPVSPG
jgi:hypothetical protein